MHINSFNKNINVFGIVRMFKNWLFLTLSQMTLDRKCQHQWNNERFSTLKIKNIAEFNKRKFLQNTVLKSWKFSKRTKTLHTTLSRLQILPSTRVDPTTLLIQGFRTTCVQSHGTLSQLYTVSFIINITRLS